MQREAYLLHRQEREFLRAAVQKIGANRQKLLQEDGFIVDPSLPIWKKI